MNQDYIIKEFVASRAPASLLPESWKMCSDRGGGGRKKKDAPMFKAVECCSTGLDFIPAYATEFLCGARKAI